FGERPIAIVAVEIRLDAVVGDKQVRPAVVVKIESADRQVLPLRLINLRGLRHVRECAVAIVVIKDRRGTWINRRRATGRNSVPDLAGAAAAGTEIDVAADIQVDKAVTVVIEEGRARMERRIELHRAYARFVRHVGELPVALFVVKDVLSVLRNIKIGAAVVVVITGHAAYAVSRARRAGLLGYIGESAVTVVAVKRVTRRAASAIKITPVDKIDVLITVAVVIEHTHARSGFFQ